jgi:hypothetical protein
MVSPSSISTVPEIPRLKLTISGEIRQLEEILRQKKEEKECMDLKYQPIVQFVVQSIKEDNLNYKFILELICAEFASK